MSTDLRTRIAQRPDYPGLVLLVALVGVAAASFAITLLSATLPTIAADLDTTYSTATWVTVAPLLVLASVTPMAGKVGDLIGHRRTFLIGMSGYLVFSLLTCLAWDIGSLIGLRVAAQAFGTIALPSAMASIMSVHPPDERARPLGLYAGVSALSPALGVIVGGPLVDLIGWRLLFAVQGAIAAVSLVLAVLVLPDAERRHGVRFDLAGALGLGVGVSGLVFAVNRGAAWGFDHPAVRVAMVLAPIGIVVFVLVERRVEQPFLPLDLLARRGFGVSLAAQGLMQAAYMGSLMITPLLIERFWGYGPWATSLLMLPRPLAFALSSWRAGTLDRSLGGRVIVVTGLVVMGVGSVVSAIGASWELLVLVVVGAGMSGGGNGATRPSLTATVANAVDEDQLGVASGSLNMTAQVGSAVGITVLVSLVENATDPGTFGWVYILAAGIGVLSMMVALTIDWSRPGTASTDSLRAPEPEPGARRLAGEA